MFVHRSFLASCVFLIPALTMLAQPGPFGCHFFHGQQAPFHPITDLEKSDINETIARSDTFDIQHYDIQLDVTDYFGQSIKGVTTITYKALQSGSGSITFDLWDLEVDSVIGPDGPMVHTYDGEFLVIDHDMVPVVDEELELTVYYRGVPHRDPEWGGFYFASNYIYNLGIGISTIPPHFGKVWYPCFDSFIERASYTYHVKSAGTFRLHGQGTFLGEVQLAGDTVIRSYALEQEIPTHVSAIAVADYQTESSVHTGAFGDIPVTLTAKPAQLSAMVSRFVDLGAAIDACEYWYGPYGYDRVGYVLTTDGALEIPTNVAYPDFMTSQNVQSNRELLTHELGHMWWGNVVTPCVHNDMWIKEGPAEYSTHLIEEWLTGQAGLERAVKSNMLYVLKQAHVNDDGFQALSPMPDEHIYGTHTYYKGAAVLHNLRGYMGDDAFRSALQGIQNEYANTTLCAADLKEALEDQSGIDLDPFFDAWVYAPGYSVFEVQDMSYEQNGDNWTVDLDIRQKLRGASVLHEEVPLDLSFISSTGVVHDEQIMVGGQSTSITSEVPFEPAMVALNRYARLNQARMDHEEVLVPGVQLDPILPYVDYRAYVDVLPDTALLRVEHIWASPDQGPLGPDILEISATHYWTVDGLWPEGTVLRSRMYYYGATATQLDHELVAGNEAGIAVVHRPDPNSSWEVYDDQIVNSGALTNGNGYITVNALRKGQYAFAKVSAIVGVEDVPYPGLSLSLFPVPAMSTLFVRGTVDMPGSVLLDVIASDGRIIERVVTQAQEAFSHELDISRLSEGMYLLRAISGDGSTIGTGRFEVFRQ